MGIFRFVLKRSKASIILVSLIGFLSGACSTGLVVLINFALNNKGARPLVLGLGFLLLVMGKILASALSQQLLYRFLQQTIWEISLALSRQFASSSLRQAERLGAPRSQAVLVEDVQVLGAAIQTIPSLVVNCAVLIGCSLYLIWLSWKAFVFMTVLAALGVLTYRAMLKKTQLSLKVAREKRDMLFGHFRVLTDGIKELKVNRVRREELQNRISKTIQDLNLHGLTAIRQYVFTDAISQFVFYSILGLLLFVIPFWNQLPMETLTGYIFAALYTMGPIWGVLATLPSLQRGQIALERIENFGNSLSIEPESSNPCDEKVLQWKALQIENLVFKYANDEDEEPNDEFVLGPIDFQLSPGQLVFVIGGNGCGKSTFVKLLCGLYAPQSGRILLDGQLITDHDRDRYRQYFSVVFSDFFLFDSILWNANVFSEAQINKRLIQLQLDNKVNITEGKFSTIALSQGQRRRLALLSVYLEDRPIYIFDEWAADQDPAYKEVFYKSLLPELRNKGKAVVVITHDDRYFGLGDRVVTLDYGKILQAQK